jgi:hypothetical protein
LVAFFFATSVTSFPAPRASPRAARLGRMLGEGSGPVKEKMQRAEWPGPGAPHR